MNKEEIANSQIMYQRKIIHDEYVFTKDTPEDKLKNFNNSLKDTVRDARNAK